MPGRERRRASRNAPLDITDLLIQSLLVDLRLNRGFYLNSIC